MPSTDLTFRSGDTRLEGTLEIPPSGATGAAALLISGSGPIDRHSDVKKMPLGVARLLAEALAAVGVATLRFDKRGVGASAGDYRSAGFVDNIADARAALGALREAEGVDPSRVAVVGHSEGAMIALALAAGERAASPPPAGVALLAGTARTGEDVLRWQAGQVEEFLPRPLRWLLKLLRVDVAGKQEKQLAKMKASDADVMRMDLVVKVNARWFREFMAFDPAPLLAAVDAPVLAVTGSEDVQVDPADVARMEALVGSTAAFEGHVVEGVNHILRQGSGNPNRYKALLEEPLDAGVVGPLLRWMGDLPARPAAAAGS